MTLYIVGFDDFVTSIIATIATGRGDPCRVGLTPTERPCLRTAHRKLNCRLEQYHSHQMNDGAALLADWGPLTAIDARRQITTLGDDIDFEAPIKRDAEGLGFLKSG